MDIKSYEREDFINLVGKKVKVYDGDFIGWTEGVITKAITKDRVRIRTKEDYEIDRFLRSGEPKADGSAYLK